jgi:hypothetical protein
VDNTLAGLRRRREAAWRLPPLDCGCRDPWTCRHRRMPASSSPSYTYRPIPFVLLSLALGAPRRAWLCADDADRATLADIAAVLIELADVAEVA